ncbi:rCG20162 [Rattus norvegicus]|uniref:RCG20162 n=1 Tax=Rattus norvegicus TaxID=10116 RepID=A6JGS3_RAT|nr:rCG20162 [Rattus norvegicus]
MVPHANSDCSVLTVCVSNSSRMEKVLSYCC